MAFCNCEELENSFSLIFDSTLQNSLGSKKREERIDQTKVIQPSLGLILFDPPTVSFFFIACCYQAARSADQYSRKCHNKPFIGHGAIYIWQQQGRISFQSRALVYFQLKYAKSGPTCLLKSKIELTADSTCLTAVRTHECNSQSCNHALLGRRCFLCIDFKSGRLGDSVRTDVHFFKTTPPDSEFTTTVKHNL